jgi:hypothetical protein
VPVPARRDDIPDKETCHDAIIRSLESLGGEAYRDDVIARALELGSFTPEQMAVPPPPSKDGIYPTYVAYRLSWALTELRRDGVVLLVQPIVEPLGPPRLLGSEQDRVPGQRVVPPRGTGLRLGATA